ncbi:MAG: LysR family transcriptional regulator [Lachnospiraceae bacterium]|nr:LysR family transcriptional regulator [Lachnospiraceae bacterium]
MELRTMRYFLAVAREENMTRAAEILHVTQPTLSKQLKALEDELGKKLFLRHSFRIQLTEEGILLRKRAEDLVRMADKITAEFLTLDDCLGGDVYFGLAESYQIRHLAAAIRQFKNTFPDMRYHITSGDTEQVTEKLDKGVIDFAVLAEEPNTAKYHFLPFPEPDVWGVVMPRDCPLSKKQTVCIDDLKGLPLFCSEQGWNHDLPRWCGNQMDELHLEGSFRLSYNGSIFVRESLGYLLTFRHLIDISPDSGLTFRPLTPELKTGIYLIWKKYQVFTPIAERLLKYLKERFTHGIL